MAGTTDYLNFLFWRQTKFDAFCLAKAHCGVFINIMNKNNQVIYLVYDVNRQKDVR